MKIIEVHAIIIIIEILKLFSRITQRKHKNDGISNANNKNIANRRFRIENHENPVNENYENHQNK